MMLKQSSENIGRGETARECVVSVLSETSGELT